MAAELSKTASEAKITCALCGAALNPGSQQCPRCGSRADRIGRCSQCQAVATLEPSGALNWVCSVCGSARLLDSTREAEPAIQQLLHDATRAHRLSKVATPIAFVAAALGVIGLLLALLLRSAFGAGDAVTAVLVSLPAFLILLSALGYTWSSKLRKTRGTRLDDAYKQALVQYLSAGAAATTPNQFSKLFGIEPRKAEQLLSQLNVRDDVTSEITDDGQLAYSIRSLKPTSEPASPMTRVLTEKLRVLDVAPLQTDPGESVDIHSPDVKTQISSVEKK